MQLCGRQKVVQRKMVLLGDGACGKTSALNVFTPSSPRFSKKFYYLQKHTSKCRLLTLVIGCTQRAYNIFVDNIHVELSLWDTAGQEEFDRLRALSYEDTHVLMLCFSVDSPDSFENVSSKWIAEINENCPGVRVVLTALKCDLRKDEDMNENPNTISFDQGLAKAKEIGAVKYLECSAVQNRGIRESFYEAAKVALEVNAGGSSSSGSQCIIQ
ncbi:Pc20g03060 [Penicillium rubens Wisconsin 54-1255]|uniref:Pc20g03060 protein n=2 Tax=Penicillium chrysogenum species complex TaxID=254878 RepID=B6HFE8_PENRW|nr:Pc20g03060 [Penicillium rubens Wisconsin 54-1255]